MTGVVKASGAVVVAKKGVTIGEVGAATTAAAETMTKDTRNAWWAWHRLRPGGAFARAAEQCAGNGRAGTMGECAGACVGVVGRCRKSAVVPGGQGRGESKDAAAGDVIR